MKLSNLKKNDKACIMKVSVKDKDTKLRLLELGFIKNTKVKIVYKQKDITVIKIRDYLIALTNDILNNIEVL